MGFLSNLEALAYGLREREAQGFSAEEKREIKQDFLAPAQAAYQALISAAEAWREESDPYASSTESTAVVRQTVGDAGTNAWKRVGASCGGR